MGMVKTDSSKLTFPGHLGADLAPRRMDIVKFLMICMVFDSGIHLSRLVAFPV
jgi:hypothetical protein